MKKRLRIWEHIHFLINFSCRLFTVLVLVLTIYTSLVHAELWLSLTPNRILKLFAFSCVLGIISMVFINLENKKWMLKLSFLQKRCLIMPVYFITIVLFIYNYFVLEYITQDGIHEEFTYNVLSMSIVTSLAAAIISSIVMNIRYKITKKEYTEYINDYKKRIGGTKNVSDTGNSTEP